MSQSKRFCHSSCESLAPPDSQPSFPYWCHEILAPLPSPGQGEFAATGTISSELNTKSSKAQSAKRKSKNNKWYLYLDSICNLYTFNLSIPALSLEQNATKVKAGVSHLLCKPVFSYLLHSASLLQCVYDPTFQAWEEYSIQAAGVRHSFFCTHDQAIVILNQLKQFAWTLPLPPFNFPYVSS